MTYRALFSLSLRPVWRSIRRWYLKRKINDIDFHIAHIQNDRKNGQLVERVLVCRRINLQAELMDL
jgi:hypothetical protein